MRYSIARYCGWRCGAVRYQSSNPPSLQTSPTLQPSSPPGGLVAGLEGWRGRVGRLEGWRGRLGALEVRYCDAVSCGVDFQCPSLISRAPIFGRLDTGRHRIFAFVAVPGNHIARGVDPTSSPHAKSECVAPPKATCNRVNPKP